ncbi:MAG TPA: hypothetical protein DD740_00410 [Chryseobacterium sp.]|nr:hypothetical protein [Chryseobacterium sp.]
MILSEALGLRQFLLLFDYVWQLRPTCLIAFEQFLLNSLSGAYGGLTLLASLFAKGSATMFGIKSKIPENLHSGICYIFYD